MTTISKLKSELHRKGIKTYYSKKTKASYIKKSDVNKILAYNDWEEVEVDQDRFEVIDVKENGAVLVIKDNSGEWEVDNIEGTKVKKGDKIAGDVLSDDDDERAVIMDITVL